MLFILLTLLSVIAGVQAPHGANNRAEMVMGFDQDATAHHFVLYADGGAIVVSVKDATDAKDLDAIRSHLPHVAMMFTNGNFDAPMLVHDTTGVPGIAVLTDRKSKVSYQYSETNSGGRVDIVTSDPQALAAVHAFLRYQIREHHTGDSVEVTLKR
jgi:hypothetical protein